LRTSEKIASADENNQAKNLLTLKEDATILKYLSEINSKSNSSINGLITVATYNHTSTFYFSSLKNMGIQTENWIPHLYHFRKDLHSKKIMNGGHHHQYVNLW
jgi:hypothetical protein